MTSPWIVMPFETGVVVCRRRADATVVLAVFHRWLDREGLRRVHG